MQTASIISRRVGLPVEVRVDLHNKVRSSERTPSRGRLLAMYPEATFPPSMTREWSPGEEDGKDVYSRLQGEVERLRLLESSHERIAIVSHAFILDALASILTGCPPKKEMRFWFDNCSLTLISCAGGVGRLHYLNLVGHLEARDLFFGG